MIERDARAHGQGYSRAKVDTSTRFDYRAILDRYLTAELRSRPLAHITAEHLQEFFNGLSARGLSPRTVSMVHAALRACLNRAVRVKRLTWNPATIVDLPSNVHSERAYFTPDQIQDFLAVARGSRWNALFVVLVFTGLRPGEAFALKWSDFDGTSLRVQRALVRINGINHALAAPKNKRGRHIPIGEQAKQALQTHRREQLEGRLKVGSAYVDNDLVFPNTLGGLADPQSVVRRYFKPLLVKAGLPQLRQYDLRHSHATVLLALGEHPKIVQERLGHSSVRLTLDTYTHVVPGMQEAATKKLDLLLGYSVVKPRANE